MNLFGMGMGEIALILLVALIIWGPEKLPDIARSLGRTVRSVRKASADFTGVINKEWSLDDAVDTEDELNRSHVNPATDTRGSKTAPIKKPSSPRKAKASASHPAPPNRPLGTGKVQISTRKKPPKSNDGVQG
ncbi:twin-arginine translocase TatA/TatE family subunit [Chloroflexota bacterium]